MAEHVSKAASWAAGLDFAKYKAFSGLPFNTCSKLYESTVDRTEYYDTAIWGDTRFHCTETVKRGALWFLIRVGQ